MSLESMYEMKCFEYKLLESNNEDLSKIITEMEYLRDRIGRERTEDIDESIRLFLYAYIRPDDIPCIKTYQKAYVSYVKNKRRRGRQPK